MSELWDYLEFKILIESAHFVLKTQTTFLWSAGKLDFISARYSSEPCPEKVGGSASFQSLINLHMVLMEPGGLAR